jgi:SRSO17 transposase
MTRPGLLMPGERKSVEPIASVVASSRVSAEHQSLLHFVGQSAWSDESVLAKVLVVPAMETQGLDCRRHGLREEGRAFGGRAATICGRLGKTDNCQVAVTLSIANHQASLPIAYRLYLHEE